MRSAVNLASLIVRVAGAAAGAAGPWLLLLLRVRLAQVFLAGQIAMAMSGQGLAPSGLGGWWTGMAMHVAASDLGGVVEAVCPLLVAAGFLCRPAAAAMLLQTLLLRMPGEQSGAGVFLGLLLLGLCVVGPGPLSLDRVLRPAARRGALPGLHLVLGAYAAIGRYASPVYVLALRLAFALSLVGTHAAQGPNMGAMGMAAMSMASLPAAPAMIAHLPGVASLAGALLLALGLGVRPVALLLLLLTPLDVSALVLSERVYWLLLLGLLCVRGGEALSLDALLLVWLRRLQAPADLAALPHVVIVGGGFGGIAAAQGLRHAPCRVTLIDRRNYHLFQPLLYQVATAGLSPADIATPIRSMFRTQANLRVLLGEVTGVDVGGQAVCLGEARLGYDALVLATGARHSYFGRDEWSGLAPGLKTIEDATAIRRRILTAFEAAEGAADPEERLAWLTFVIIGGGPTGVELAGAIAELARFGMEGEFRVIDPAEARVILVQSGPVLLPSFPKSLSLEAAASLRRVGVELRLDAKAEDIDASGVRVSGVHLPARTVLWAAGVMASPAASWLGVAADRAGRVTVGPDLRVAGCGEVFAIGDTALCRAWQGEPVPGLAPAAKQEGKFVARVIRARLLGHAAPAAFSYRHPGSLATIGRRAAVADFGWIRLHGALAWWFWGAAHIVFLVGGRNRAGVILEWFWDYLTFRRGIRLITGTAESGV
jgi:NADH dehydrogenase/putative oxidoreductase